ncbi:DUF1763-domain-containing protein [Choiromyces venosus 120613-1]|uniref:DUF1763-domain-containing protein n=1 Tax=Choiromyces venosus 120613-1 TaxID=1336337 RepID=A0A3N4IY94_9PEZI|nr:DUF1763-domain-containing protein [Choiromyces venosus 120613-1]
MLPDSTTVIHNYRALYKAALAACQYSSPSRYCVRDKLRKAFRKSDPNRFSQQRIDNTIEFLRTAARRKGMEHYIIKNLCMVEYWQQHSRNNRKLVVGKSNIPVTEQVFSSYLETLGLLNQSMDLELR